MNRNLLYSLFAVGLVSFTGLLSNSYMSRALSEEEFGFFSQIFLIVSLTTLLDGLKPIVTFFVAKEDWLL